MRVTVECGRCHKVIEGLASEAGTAGYYWVGPGSAWEDFGRPGEVTVCDPCMWADPKYIAAFGDRTLDLREVG